MVDGIQITEGLECWTKEFDKGRSLEEGDPVCIFKSSLWHLCIESLYGR